MVKVVDTFSFNGEWIVKVRLAYLFPHVDHFVIVEARETHSGKPKEFLYKDKCSEWFRPYESKITWLVIDRFPEATDAWREKYQDAKWILNNHAHWFREMHQRDYAARYITNMMGHDHYYISVGDVDEIPSAKLVEEANREEVYSTLCTSFVAGYIEMDFYYYNFEWVKSYKWHRAYLLPKNHLTEKCTLSYWRVVFNPTILFPRGGWHFSYFMSPSQLQRKLSSFAHRECDTTEHNSEEHIRHCIATGKDLFGRGGEGLTKTSLTTLPPMFHNYHDELVKLQQGTTFHEDWYPDNQCDILCATARKVRHLDGSAIEIGCWEGKSASRLANTMYPDNLLCVDDWLGNVSESQLTGQLHVTEVVLRERDVYRAFLNNMNSLTRGNYVVVKEECTVWLQSYKEAVKFCHIDASHDYTSVSNTIKQLKPLVVQGGILCGDDFVNANAQRADLQGGVERAVREHLPGFVTEGNFWYWVQP